MTNGVKHTEHLPDGSVLVIIGGHFKPKILRNDGSSVGLCLDLKNWYDKRKGFVERRARTDAEAIKIGVDWAYSTMRSDFNKKG